jgi:hypothetical protein
LDKFHITEPATIMAMAAIFDLESAVAFFARAGGFALAISDTTSLSI